MDSIDRWDRGFLGRPTPRAAPRRGTARHGTARRRDARRANDDVAVCPGTAETKPTDRRTGTTERASENGDDDDDDGGGGCDSQRRCVARENLYCVLYFIYFIVWGMRIARNACLAIDEDVEH